MRALSAMLFAVSIPTAMAQHPNRDAMTEPVTPRDIPWYMAHQDVLRQTLTVCHSNAAYGPTPDCQNAERASLGLMARQKQQTANQQLATGIYSPQFWDQNPIQRNAIITQCNRRGPGDEIAYPFCRVAAESQLRSLDK